MIEMRRGEHARSRRIPIERKRRLFRCVSRREHEILTLLSQGFSQPEIAKALC
jgi:DNA-binding NarL/FixJ family response regulator